MVFTFFDAQKNFSKQISFLYSANLLQAIVAGINSSAKNATRTKAEWLNWQKNHSVQFFFVVLDPEILLNVLELTV